MELVERCVEVLAKLLDFVLQHLVVGDRRSRHLYGIPGGLEGRVAAQINGREPRHLAVAGDCDVRGLHVPALVEPADGAFALGRVEAVLRLVPVLRLFGDGRMAEERDGKDKQDGQD